MVKTLGITHIQISVSDVPRSLAFYKTLFGMEEQDRGEPDPTFVFLRTPGCRDTFTLNGDSDAQSHVGQMGGIQHFGFAVADPAEVERAVSLVEQAGGKLLRQGVRGTEAYVFVTDPDGYKIEIFSD